MATFSLGTSGVTPGAPGVYINEQAGRAANASLADFSTVYMLVETDEDVPVTRFPYNQPTAITSLNDYKELIRVGTSTVPEGRIPLLSYNCVNEFFQNAQVGDLRVVRVGTPDQIVEIEFLPSGTKQNSSDLPSAFMAGDEVYVQMVINGQQLVAGDGSTGYTADGEWLGVPVVIPVSYVAGDEANNRRISGAFADAVAAAIESNPSIRSSVYVRDFGQMNDLDPIKNANSENSYVTVASTTFNANVTVVTQVLPVGSTYVAMQSTYDLQNIVGGSTNLVRVPQDYTQCIATAFDGQQDQGYLITPTAYAQFDAEGRALVGAAAAEHCASNNYKWLALADPGPFLVTDVNKYEDFTPHQAAEDLIKGQSYLVDNAIYEWVGNSVTYNRLDNQNFVSGVNPGIAINESANLVADSTKVGLQDAGKYTVTSSATADNGVFQISAGGQWPVDLPIQKVAFSGVASGTDFANVDIQGGATGVNLNNTEVYVIAAPYDLEVSSDYSLNYILLAQTAGDASNIYNTVKLAGGSKNVTAPISGSIIVPTPTGTTAEIAYADPFWDLPVDINGQTSNLIENISGASAGVNTLHLPGTLQDFTAEYALNWVSRTLYDPSAQIARASGSTSLADGTAIITVEDHGLRDGQNIFFTNTISTFNATTTTPLIRPTTKSVSRPYVVKTLTTSTFVIAPSLADYAAGSYVSYGTGLSITSHPSTFYTEILGRSVNSITAATLTTLPMIRGRKYGFDTSSIFNVSLSAAETPGTLPVVGLTTRIFLNNSSTVLGEAQISAWGEDLTVSSKCGYLPSLLGVTPTLSPVVSTNNAYCVPTVDQSFQSEAYLVPSIDSIFAGDYDPTAPATLGPATAATIGINVAPGVAPGTYNDVSIEPSGVSIATGAKATLVVDATNSITSITFTSGGQSYSVGEAVSAPDFSDGTATFTISSIDDAGGSLISVTTYANDCGLTSGMSASNLEVLKSQFPGTYMNVVNSAGTAPGGEPVVVGDRIALTYNDGTYDWVIVPSDANGGDLSTVATVLYGSQVELTFSPEQAVPSNLWRFDAITSTEIISDALRGIGFNGAPQAELVEAGVDNVNRLLEDSQRYSNPFGFIAYYGPYIENGAGQFIPPSPYVTGVALRRYRSEGYQFPPAGVKYQLADAVAAQIPVNSAQQNLLNPKGCNVVRTLPGYPDTAVYIWGGRTRLGNPDDAQQKLYQFVNTRVILNVVYGSLRNAFDSQIFNAIDGFGVIFNQIISVGNSILNQLYIRGALFGARPSDAFQVICDERINSSEDLENGIVNAKVFVTPVPTLERIQIDLIRVAIGKMQEELDIQGLSNR
jgi:hypothetical protein